MIHFHGNVETDERQKKEWGPQRPQGPAMACCSGNGVHEGVPSNASNSLLTEMSYIV